MPTVKQVCRKGFGSMGWKGVLSCFDFCSTFPFGKFKGQVKVIKTEQQWKNLSSHLLCIVITISLQECNKESWREYWNNLLWCCPISRLTRNSFCWYGHHGNHCTCSNRGRHWPVCCTEGSINFVWKAIMPSIYSMTSTFHPRIFSSSRPSIDHPLPGVL